MPARPTEHPETVLLLASIARFEMVTFAVPLTRITASKLNSPGMLNEAGCISTRPTPIWPIPTSVRGLVIRSCSGYRAGQISMVSPLDAAVMAAPMVVYPAFGHGTPGAPTIKVLPQPTALETPSDMRTNAIQFVRLMDVNMNSPCVLRYAADGGQAGLCLRSRAGL